MKGFLRVFSFEFAGFIKGKWFRISTILICLLIAIVMFAPRFLDIGGATTTNQSLLVGKVGVYDPNHVLDDENKLRVGFPYVTFVNKSSIDEVKQGVMNEQFLFGIQMINKDHYVYLVMNSSMNDTTSYVLDSVMQLQYKSKILQTYGLSDVQIEQALSAGPQGEISVLGKDGKMNYLYTYLLLFALYFVVIFYGQLTATNVASEKGNRMMEILVTSTTSNALIFGKVLAGAIAGILQVSIILGTSILAYQLNADTWGNALDFLFHIPANVLLTFALFGSLGYLFYSFIYGALGSMVSKIEDVSSAITPIMILFVICFFVVFMGVLPNPESLISSIASYVPFTSCMAMFVRVAMGQVEIWQVCLSALILLLSVIAMGMLGAKLYRQGTLHYGNDFKMKQLYHFLKRKKG